MENINTILETETLETETLVELEIDETDSSECGVEFEIEVGREPKAKKEKAPKAEKVKKPQYPFRSKGSIVEQINEDNGFMLECLQIMADRQTSFEQESKRTVVKNRRGFMSSHAVNGTKLAEKARTEGLNAEETDKARSIVSRYGKQLAEHFRAEKIKADPSLNEVAAMFSAAVELDD